MPSTASAEPSAVASSTDAGIDSSGDPGVAFDPSDVFDPFAPPASSVEFPAGRGAGVGAPVELSSDAFPSDAFPPDAFAPAGTSDSFADEVLNAFAVISAGRCQTW